MAVGILKKIIQIIQTTLLGTGFLMTWINIFSQKTKKAIATKKKTMNIHHGNCEHDTS